MTVCIAAMAEGGKKVVLASDRMITASFPIPYEFETDDVPKVYRLDRATIAMSAGNALSAYEIIERAKAQIASQQISKVEQIAETVRRSYQDCRRGRAVEQLLEPRGLTLESYYNIQQKLVLGVVQDVESKLTSFNLKVELILAGCEEKGECHIFTISHPGVSLLHDAVGYVSIGSGAPHVMYYFMGSEYKKGLPVERVEEMVREAKKKSEVAPGVGKQTELIIIPPKEVASVTQPRQ